MTTASEDSKPRVAIWTISPTIIGAYFGIFLIQYIPGAVFGAYRQMQQATDAAFADTAFEVIKASGPIGIGSAMNAIAIALLLEATMVLARMLSKQQREQGLAEGRAQERKRSNAKLRAWAKEKGIPIEELPLEDETEDDR